MVVRSCACQMGLLLILVQHLGFVFASPYSLYYTVHQEKSLETDAFDSLHYVGVDELKFKRQPITRTSEVIPYCRRPVENEAQPNSSSERRVTNVISFAELRRRGVSSQQLLDWSAPVNIAERYQMHSISTEYESVDEFFYNCTSPWFGSMCQYTFGARMGLLFNQIIHNTLHNRRWKSESQASETTCYTHLACMRGPFPLCLDWREVCNGKIDCLGDEGGQDEMYCDSLEANVCGADEYRCHNGQCIPLVFVQDGSLTIDCLDGTDEEDSQFLESSLNPNNFYRYECSDSPSFLCEERTCRWRGTFPCGDGSCLVLSLPDSRACSNGRAALSTKALFAHLPTNNHLSTHCWSSLICTLRLTKIVTALGLICENQVSVETLPLLTHVDQCPSEVFIPASNYRFFDHLHFVYFANRTIAEFKRNVSPDLVCFDEKSCPGLLPASLNISGRMCHHLYELGLSKVNDWWRFTKDLRKDVLSRCETVGTAKIEQCNVSSALFYCDRSSKCISTARLLDRQSDCYYGEDENALAESCALNSSQRFSCKTEHKCISSLGVDDGFNQCAGWEDERGASDQQHNRRPPMTRLCDTVRDMLPDAWNETDETHCELWPCETPYVRCDGHWNCPNGHDELNCALQPLACPHDEHPCVKVLSNEPMCLPLNRTNDGTVDCRGAADERSFCQLQFPEENFMRYQCWNTSTCIDIDRLCINEGPTCMSREEQRLCPSNVSFPYGFCSTLSHRLQNASVSEKLLCSLITPTPYGGINQYRMDAFFSTSHLGNLPNDVHDTLSDVSSASLDIDKQVTTAPLSLFPFVDDDLAWYCHRGVAMFEGSERTKVCLCPPSYYGSQCQFQSQRVSLTLRFRKESTVTRLNVFHFVISLLDVTNYVIQSFDHLTYVPQRDCDTKFNIYLLYANRSKNKDHNYSVHIDVYDQLSLAYRASWHLTVVFPFLPVNRLAAELTIPAQQLMTPVDCPLICGNHGQCLSYLNSPTAYFCHCEQGWSGRFCDAAHKCMCAPDALCLGPSSMCLCPIGSLGMHCYLQRTACQPNPCQHDGYCVPNDERTGDHTSATCLCVDGYSGLRCELSSTSIEVGFKQVAIPRSLLVHFITAFNNSEHRRVTKFAKVPFDQYSAKLYTVQEFHILFVEFSESYYLAVLREKPRPSESIVTLVSPMRQCSSVHEHLNSTILQYHYLRRIKYYQLPCKASLSLLCFYDSKFMCVCDRDRYANCFEFDHNMTYNCQGVRYCENNAACYQDDPSCPISLMCICPECFYGSRCQFSTKGFSLSLDNILAYHIKPKIALQRQPTAVQVSIALTTFMLILGIASSLLSILTFRSKHARDVGCGVYLLAASIVSLITINIFALKVWLLFLSQSALLTSRVLVLAYCIITDALLKVLLSMNNWLNACIAVERMVAVVRGAHFNKGKSKRIAQWVVPAVTCTTILSTLHDPIYRRLIHDEDEDRTWCVVQYTAFLKVCDSVITLFHFLTPFVLNVISAFIIIMKVARHRSTTRTHQSYKQHLREQFYEHKHLIISPCTLTVLTLPSLTISFMSGCMKSARNPWLFLVGYIISFVPPMLVFVVFVLPSTMYQRELIQAIRDQRSTVRQYLVRRTRIV